MALVFLTGTTIAGPFFVDRTDAVTVIKSSAQAWVWVAPVNRQRFVDELRDYARDKGLQLHHRKLLGPPWEIAEVTLLTPKENKISVANATAPDKFSAAIIVYRPEENWQIYWKEFRAYVSARYKWEDVP